MGRAGPGAMRRRRRPGAQPRARTLPAMAARTAPPAPHASAASASSSSSAPPPDATRRFASPRLLGSFTQLEAASLAAIIAAGMDRRFMAMDLSQGSRIPGAEVAAEMGKATGKAWPPT
jgi:hypothetical protein